MYICVYMCVCMYIYIYICIYIYIYTYRQQLLRKLRKDARCWSARWAGALACWVGHRSPAKNTCMLVYDFLFKHLLQCFVCMPFDFSFE